MYHARFAAIAVAVALAGPVNAQETTADTVVATVNGLDITVGHMILARTSLPQQYQQLPDDVLFENLLEQMIQQAAIASTSDTLSKRGTFALENARRAQHVEDAIGVEMEAALTDDALQAAYDAAYSGTEPEEEFNAAHILVETEDEANALKTQLDEGADFAELAQEHSTGPSGPNGGDLGWFGKGMMVPEFETAVLVLEPGGTSDPVQTQFGWHVVRLNEVRMKDAPPLDQVRAELAQQIQKETIERVVSEATDSAEVTKAEDGSISPSVLSDESLLGQ